MAETPADRLARLRARFAEAAAQVEADRQAGEEGAPDAGARPSSAAVASTASTQAPAWGDRAAPAGAEPEEERSAPAPIGAVAAPTAAPAAAVEPPAAPAPTPTWEPSPQPAPPSPAPPSPGPPAGPTAAAPSGPPPSGAPPVATRVKPAPPPRSAGTGVSTAVLVGAAVVILALFLIGAGIALGRVSQESGVKYSDLKAGDCFQQPSGRFNKVKTVPCTTDHDLEVYAVLDHPAPAKAPFPGMDALVRYANPLCLAQFRTYAGVAFEQLNLRDVYITPRQSAWNDGARRLVCAVGSSNGERTAKSIKAGAR